MKQFNINFKIKPITATIALLLVLFTGLQAQMAITFEVNSPACNDYTNGSAEAIVTGGEAPYIYMWENGTRSAMLDGVGAGEYEITVTDSDGVQEIATATIVDPPRLAANIRNSGDICASINGSLVAEVSGGTLPYTYQWSNGDTEIQSNNLQAGQNILTVTDANGCLAIATIQVAEEFLINTTASDVLCTDYCDGVVKVNINGGTAPYDVQWSTGVENVTNIDLLPPGTYTVTVTDANGCNGVETAVVGEPEAIIIDLSITDVCDATIDNLSASVNVSGGNEPYQIQWSNGAQGTTTTNLSRGTTYFVNVTDRNGCTAEQQITIPNDPELILTARVTNTACNNNTNGSASVSASGGESYTYSWSNGATTAEINDLIAGTYTVTVTASSGCSAVESVEVMNGDELLLFPTSVNATCAGVNNGMANVLVEGGELPYTILWEDGQTTQTALDLEPGTYSVTATDRLGCTGTTSVVVGANSAIDVSFNNNNPTCDAATNGSTSINVSGGVAPYTYQWNNGADTEAIDNLEGGTYSVTVTDNNGCITEASTTLIGAESITPNFSFAITACNGNEVTVMFTDNSDIAGDKLWMFSNGEISNEDNPTIQINNGETIEATLSITTTENCSGTTTESVTAIPIELTVPDMLTACKDEAAQLNVMTNADGILTYEYSPTSAFVSGTDTNMPSLATDVVGQNMVTITVTDELGCSATESVMINVTEEVSGDPEAVSTSQCEGLVVDFSNTIEGVEYTYDFGDGTNSTQVGGNVNYEYSEPGTYIVTLTPTSNANCAAPIEKEIVVTSPNEVDFSNDTEICSADGQVSFMNESTINADNVMYSWEFSNGTTSNEENPMITLTENGTVEAILTASFGENCTISSEQSFELIIFDPAEAEIEDVIACAGEEVELNPNANDDLTYVFENDGTLINPESNNPSVELTETNVYNVTITDPTGQCEIMDEVAVEVPPMIETTVSDDVVQCGATLVNLEASSEQAEEITWFISGEEEPLGMGENYEFAPMQRTTDFIIRFTDEFDCSVEEMIQVNNNDPQVEIETPESICGGTDAEIIVNNLIEGDMLSYQWTPDNIDVIDDATSPMPMVSPEETTTFVVMITNQLGCTIEEEALVEVSKIDGLEVTAAKDTILAGESTDLSVNRNGELTYKWTPEIGVSDPTSPNPVVSPPTTTTYKVEVEDENGCTTEREITVTVLQSNCTEGFIYLPNAFTPNDDGQNDVLFVRGFSITDVYLIIYNRWGEKVFESNSINNGWDGTFNGEKVCSDVYGYYLEVTCFGGERFIDQGNITVLK